MYILVENVCGFFRDNDNEVYNVFQTKLMGYFDLELETINSEKYGLPQKRKRDFVIGQPIENINKVNLKEELLKFEYKRNITLREAISDLEIGCNKENPMEYIKEPESRYQEYMRSGSLKCYNHITVDHSEDTINVIIEAREEGHKNEKSKKAQRYRIGRANMPANTVTSEFSNPSGLGDAIHYSENRTYTPREAARLQGFKDDFIFYGTKNDIRKQIGDAVPPIISQILFTIIKKNVIENYGNKKCE